MTTRKDDPKRKYDRRDASGSQAIPSQNTETSDEVLKYSRYESPSFQKKGYKDNNRRKAKDIFNDKYIFEKDKVTITIGTELWPSNENILIVSTDDSGQVTKRHLNGLVLNHINVDPESFRLNKKQLNEIIRDGYTSITLSDRIIFLISTLEIKNRESKLVKIENSLFSILSALEANISISKFNVYLPLLGTGDSGLPILHSFDLVISALEKHSRNSSTPLNITLSIPPERTDENMLSIIQFFKHHWGQVNQNRTTKRSFNEKIDFHLDDPALEDKLGRKPIANSLAKLINDDIFGNEKCHAFMVHLQGRWGEGKSSFMKFMENGLQEAGKDRWIVIHYNAWKNQTVDPPWWTFLDALYKQSRKQVANKRPFYSRYTLIFNELINRFNKPSLHLIIFVLILSILVLISTQFKTQLEDTFGFLKPILGESKITLLALLGGGSLITIIQSWSKFLLMDNAENARLFVDKTENPSEAIKHHFENLVRSIQKRSGNKDQPFKIAFFIDDLDRCNSKFIVKLLEGIQTMFNEQKVFYLVAADKHWIAKSFEKVYEDYASTVKPGTKLGYSFIEKNFQLSIRLPNPSKEQVSRYWAHILNKNSSDPVSSPEKQEALKKELRNVDQADILSGNSGLNKIAKELNITLEDAQAAMLETVNETTEDIEHLLNDHHQLLGNNPRAVKRLANQYTVYRNLVLIEQNKVDPLKLFRWVVLQNRWPVLVDKLEQDPANINNYGKLLKELDLVSYSIDIEYVMGKGEERLTLDDVINYTGINQIETALPA